MSKAADKTPHLDKSVYSTRQKKLIDNANLPYKPEPLAQPTAKVGEETNGGKSDELTPPRTPELKAEADGQKGYNDKNEDDVPTSYVAKALADTEELPPITWRNFHKEVNWPQALVLWLEPFLALYGLLTTKLTMPTLVFAIVYYFMTGLGITAGYHRLWAHRSYTASTPLKYFLVLMAAGSVQGSVRWWARGHRAHHRYTDTDLDPYGAHKGLFYSHIGWMTFKPRRKPGVADVSDLSRDPVVKFQHNHYLKLAFLMAIVVPTLVCGLGWGDYKGGYFYAALLRLVFVHHSTFCVNSLAHYLGEKTFDDKHTPGDHWLTALVTLGEGYHNFHHEFPNDYRNAIRMLQWDPTKWFILGCSKVGLSSQLKTFPDNEVEKGRLNMEMKRLEQIRESLIWPSDSNNLPVLTWDQYQDATKEPGRLLVAVGGFIHDCSAFVEEHPGGKFFIKRYVGKDATQAWHGGVYDHSRAAANLMAMLRVGVLQGGMEVEAGKREPQVPVVH